MDTIMKWFGYGNSDLAAVERNGEGNTMNSTMIPSVEVGTPRRHKAEKLAGGSERVQNQDYIWAAPYQRLAKKDMQLDVFVIGTANGGNTLPSLLARSTQFCVVL
jgi:hypothetical protein